MRLLEIKLFYGVKLKTCCLVNLHLWINDVS